MNTLTSEVSTLIQSLFGFAYIINNDGTRQMTPRRNAAAVAMRKTPLGFQAMVNANMDAHHKGEPVPYSLDTLTEVFEREKIEPSFNRFPDLASAMPLCTPSRCNQLTGAHQ